MTAPDHAEERAVARLSMQIGVALFQAMLMRDVTFADIAKALNVTEPEVRRWMVRMISGRPGRNSLGQAAGVAHALDCEFSIHAAPRECEP